MEQIFIIDWHNKIYFHFLHLQYMNFTLVIFATIRFLYNLYRTLLSVIVITWLG